MLRIRKPSQFLRGARLALSPRSSLIGTKLANGVVVYGMNRAGYGGRGIYLDGEDIEPELKHLQYFLQPGAVFFDIGANTGMFALKAASIVGTDGTVVAVDPSIEMLHLLAHGVRKNRFDNVRLRNLCLGRATGTGTLWLNDGEPNRFSLLKIVGAAAPASVLVATLDDLFQWERLPRLDYVKMDVVGAEDEVLAGAQEVIARFRPIVQVAVSNREVQTVFENYGTYRVPGGLNKVYIPDGDPRIAAFITRGWQRD
jgi:FkbM family methyltransferase